MRFLYDIFIVSVSSLSLTLIAVFAFSRSSLNLPPSSDPSISAQNSRHRAANMQICQAQVRCDFSPNDNNSFTISIYLLPAEESDRKSYNKKLMSLNYNWGRCLARNLLWLRLWWYWIAYTSRSILLCKTSTKYTIILCTNIHYIYIFLLLFIFGKQALNCIGLPALNRISQYFVFSFEHCQQHRVVT